MGGMLAPIPGIGKPAGRAMTDVATLGLAELLPNKLQDPLNNAVGSVFFSPAAGLAAGGAGLLGAGGIGAGGMGAAAPGAPAVGGIPAGSGSMIGEAAKTGAGGGGGMSGTNMLQNAFLATSVGGMLGNAIKPPPPPSMGVPNAPIGGGGSFTPVANSASQQWAQLMAQRRAQQMGKFTV